MLYLIHLIFFKLLRMCTCYVSYVWCSYICFIRL